MLFNNTFIILQTSNLLGYLGIFSTDPEMLWSSSSEATYPRVPHDQSATNPSGWDFTRVPHEQCATNPSGWDFTRA